MKNEEWSDTNRFNQTGYSAPTIFPKEDCYRNKFLFMEDLAKAEAREQSHLEWLWEQREEARIDYLESKYEQEEWM